MADIFSKKLLFSEIAVRQRSCFVLSMLLINCLLTIAQEDTKSKHVFLRRCKSFQDERNVTSDDIYIQIPDNLTNSDKKVDFGETVDSCESSFNKVIQWEDGKPKTVVSSSKKGVRLRNSLKYSNHFTHEGYFHDVGHYYKPDEFCVKSLSEAAIELNICKTSCKDSLCIPKCCSPNEVLIYWNFTCRKVSENEETWKVPLYEDTYPYARITDGKKLRKVHINRQHLSCDGFENWALTDALRAKKKDYSMRDRATRWKFTESGRPVYFANNRKWVEIPEGEFCIDGFANWGLGGSGKYSGEEEKHSVLLLCPSIDNNNSMQQFSEARAWTYTVALLISSVFLLLTAVIHLLLLDKQHLHGLTVLCHSISMFLMYIFFVIAHVVSIYPQIKGNEPRGTFCMIIAISSHYFFMTTFVWLSIMNFDLWLTFRSMRPVSKLSKRIRRFWIYFTIGWGLPAILGAGFYGVDYAYRDPTSEVVVPDYADITCFVAIWARGYYMYSLVAIALSFNTILVAWTFYIFYEFRIQNAHTFTTRRAKSDKYSIRLFLKLFCIMGVAWFVELVSWKYNGDTKPWILVGLDCIMFLQAFAIFFVFCINRRTLAQLEEKYPSLRGLIGPIRQYRWLKAYSDVEGVEMTTPGSTPRKLSVSVTTTTLPRKSSNCSVRSAMNSKSKSNVTNGKLESPNINLELNPESGPLLGLKTDAVNHAPGVTTNLHNESCPV